jgi:hypothetical protein
MQKETLSNKTESTTASQLPRDIEMDDTWATSKLRKLIDQRCAEGRKPTHLFLGQKEADLLRQHLGEAFGHENATRLEHIWYMGLRVIELQTESAVRVAGEQFISKLDVQPEQLSSLNPKEIATRWSLGL